MDQLMINDEMFGSLSIIGENELLCVNGGGWLADFCNVASMVCTAAAFVPGPTQLAFSGLALGYQAAGFAADKLGY